MEPYHKQVELDVNITCESELEAELYLVVELEYGEEEVEMTSVLAYYYPSSPAGSEKLSQDETRMLIYFLGGYDKIQALAEDRIRQWNP